MLKPYTELNHFCTIFEPGLRTLLSEIELLRIIAFVKGNSHKLFLSNLIAENSGNVKE